jgi:hypothetical protein
VPALQVEAEAISCLREFAELFPSVLDPLGLKVKLNVCNEGGQTRTSFSWRTRCAMPGSIEHARLGQCAGMTSERHR